MIWYAIGGGKQVAHRTASGEVVLDFGRHRGHLLREVDDSYLGWMLSRAGRVLLPADLLELVAGEQHARATGDNPAVGAMRFYGETVVRWAAHAPAGDVADLAHELRVVAAALDIRLEERALMVCASLQYPDEPEAVW